MEPVDLFLNIGNGLKAAVNFAAEGNALSFGLCAVESVVPRAQLAFQCSHPFIWATGEKSAPLLLVLLHNRLQLPPCVFMPFGRNGKFVGNEGAGATAFGAIRRRGFLPAVCVRTAQGGAAFETDVIMVGHGCSLFDRWEKAAQSAGCLQRLPARPQRICHFQTHKGGKGIFNQFFTIIRPQVLQLVRYFAGQTIRIASQNHDAATKEQQREPLTPIAGHLGRLHMRIFRPHPDFPSQKHIHRRYYPY